MERAGAQPVFARTRSRAGRHAETMEANHAARPSWHTYGSTRFEATQFEAMVKEKSGGLAFDLLPDIAELIKGALGL
jgi:hypothetical protein